MIRIAYQTKRGTHVMKCLPEEKAGKELARLWAQRIETRAWKKREPAWEEDRVNLWGCVWKLDGKWIYVYER